MDDACCLFSNCDGGYSSARSIPSAKQTPALGLQYRPRFLLRSEIVLEDSGILWFYPCVHFAQAHAKVEVLANRDSCGTNCVLCACALPDGRVVSGSGDGTLRVWDPSTGECLDVLETTEVDVSHMDFSDAILTEDVARLLWHGRATISDADYERYVKPYRKPYKNGERQHE